MHCRFIARSRRVNVPTLRLYSAYGPFEEPTRLMPTIVVRGMAGELPPLVTPETARDYVHVDDVCDAFVLAATVRTDEPGAVYNIGTGTQTTLRELVAEARSLMDIKAEPQWGTMANRLWDTSVWVADNRKAIAMLGWSPRHTLTEGLSAFVGWFGKNPAMTSFYRQPQSQACAG